MPDQMQTEVNNKLSANLHEQIALVSGSEQASHKAFQELFPPTPGRDPLNYSQAKMFENLILQDSIDSAQNEGRLPAMIKSLEAVNKNPEYHGETLSPEQIKADQQFLIDHDHGHLYDRAVFAPDGSISFKSLTIDDCTTELQKIGAPKVKGEEISGLIPQSYLDVINNTRNSNGGKDTDQERKLEGLIKTRLNQWEPLIPAVNKRLEADSVSTSTETSPARLAANEIDDLKSVFSNLHMRENDGLR